MANFDTLIRAGARRPRVIGDITFVTGVTETLTASDIISFAVHEGVSDGMLLGAAISANASVTLNGEKGAWLHGGSKRGTNPLPGARVTLALALDGTTETRPICTFYVSEVRAAENDARVTLSGADALSAAFTEAFTDGQTYPRTLHEIASYIASAAGYSLAGGYPNADVVIAEMPDWGDISLRGAIGYCACAAGCFAKIDRSGALVFAPVYDRTTPYALPAANTLSRVYGEIAFGAAQALMVSPYGMKKGESNLEYGIDGAIPTDGNALRIRKNPLFTRGAAHTDALARGALTALGGMTLTCARTTWQGDPALTVGRRVSITDHEGNATVTTVTRQSLVYENGFSMSSDCTLKSAYDTGAGALINRQGGISAARLSGEIDGGIIRAGTIAAASLIAGSITAQQLAAGSIGAEQIQAGAITADSAAIADAAITSAKIADAAISSAKIIDGAITTAKIDDAAVISAKIANAAVTNAKIAAAAIKTANIETGAITTALIGTGAVETALLADASVTDAKIVSLTANKITAGVIDASVIEVNNLTADNIVTGTINGQRIPTLGTDKLQDGAVTTGKLAGASVTADKLVAGAVTAEKVAAEAITANKIASNAVTAAKIDTVSLFASNAFTGALRTSVIESDIGQSLDISSNDAIRLKADRSTVSATVAASAIERAGYRLELSFSKGAVVSLSDMTTVCSAKVYRNDSDITDLFDASAFSWKRISSDTASDAAWNAAAGHSGVKSISLTMADAAGSAVIECAFSLGDSLLPVTLSIEDGDLLVETEDGQAVFGGLTVANDGNLTADALGLYAINESGELVYNAPDSLTARADITAGIKTSYITIRNDAIDISSGGKLNISSGGDMAIAAGGDFSLKGGDAAGEYLGISSTDATAIFTGANNASGDSPKFSVSKYGEMTARNANISGAVHVSGEMSFGGDITVSFGSAEARVRFLRALADANALPYAMGGTNATTRTDAMKGFGMQTGDAEANTITAQNVGDRYLLIKGSSIVSVSANTPTLARAGYYQTVSVNQRRNKTVTTYTLLSGDPSGVPSGGTSYSYWYDNGSPTTGNTASASSPYCHTGAGTASDQYSGAVTTTTSYEGSQAATYYRKTVQTNHEYRTIQRNVYRATMPAPTAGSTDASIKSSGVRTATLTLTLSQSASAEYTLSRATDATGATNKTFIATQSGAGSLSFDVTDLAATMYAGAIWFVLETTATTETTVTGATLALTYYDSGQGKRAEEYIWNGSEWLKIAAYTP